MSTSTPILQSASASPSDFRATSWLQSPRDWHSLLPLFSPALSSLSTQSSSTRLCDEDKQQTQGPSGTPRTNVPTRSLSVDTSDDGENQAVCQAQSQGKQKGSSSVGIKGAPPCPVGGTALISNPINQFESSRELPIFLPSRYEFCPVEDMVELISHMLGELIATNDLDTTTSGGLTRFHSRTAPGISVRDYLHRLAVHAALAPSLLLAMVYYVDRLCALYQGFSINTLTVHRFLIAAATVAARGLSDAYCRFSTYAQVGGVAVKELHILEFELLYRLDWRIVPDPEDLAAYYQGLIERIPGYEFEPDASGEDPSKS